MRHEILDEMCDTAAGTVVVEGDRRKHSHSHTHTHTQAGFVCVCVCVHVFEVIKVVLIATMNNKQIDTKCTDDFQIFVAFQVSPVAISFFFFSVSLLLYVFHKRRRTQNNENTCIHGTHHSLLELVRYPWPQRRRRVRRDSFQSD